MKDIILYTNFLNLNELHIFHSNSQKFSFVKWKISGGYEVAERQIVAFIPDAFSFYGEEIPFPISVLRIEPCNPHFSDSLTHRDYLGAVLNLGIDRSQIGDIVVDGTAAFLFCKTPVKELICQDSRALRPHDGTRGGDERKRHWSFNKKRSHKRKRFLCAARRSDRAGLSRIAKQSERCDTERKGICERKNDRVERISFKRRGYHFRARDGTVFI